MSISSFAKGEFLKVLVAKVQKSEPKTTVLGAALAGVVGTQIDYNKLAQGDTQQIALLVAGILVAVIGYYTNNPGQAPPQAGK